MHKLFGYFIAVFLLSHAAQASDTHGVLMIVKGDVSVDVSKSGKTEKAKVGFKIYPGDAIVTGKDSRAKLVMIDKNVINISPDSKFVLEKYVYNPDEDKKDVSINVLYGKVRNTVNQKYDGEKNKFHVKTASAVAGVRGTDFVVQFNKTTKVAKVFTFKGRVEVGKGLDALGRIANPVFVTPGQFTVAGSASQPSLPVTANPMEMQTMNNQTDAEKGADPADNKDRMPANEGDDKNGKSPNGPSGTEGNPNQIPPPVFDPTDPPPTGGTTGGCIGGACLPPPIPTCPGGICNFQPVVNPEYNKGNTKLLINVQ